jgi:NAD(P)-dependent dehydrogenase (short-subunit alcohol dehydrogenase family)
LLAHPATAEVLCSTVPMPFGGVTDAAAVAHVLAFLAAAELRSVTGQTLFVDGGADCVRKGDDVWP